MDVAFHITSHYGIPWNKSQAESIHAPKVQSKAKQNKANDLGCGKLGAFTARTGPTIVDGLFFCFFFFPLLLSSEIWALENGRCE